MASSSDLAEVTRMTEQTLSSRLSTVELARNTKTGSVLPVLYTSTEHRISAQKSKGWNLVRISQCF